MKLEDKVLFVFGRVIRPANWLIFGAGVVLMFVAPLVFFLLDLDALGSSILFIQGVQLMVEGYGNVKQDEDVDIS